MYIQGEDVAQSDPDTKHVEEALRNMECLVVQDLFLNETAKFAHVFLPGTSFLEKDGTFTNTDRRVQLGRKAIEPPGDAKQDLRLFILSRRSSQFRNRGRLVAGGVKVGDEFKASGLPGHRALPPCAPGMPSP